MTRNRNANKKEEINEGVMQLASFPRKKITNNNWSALKQLTATTGVLIVLQKKKFFSSFCQ